MSKIWLFLSTLSSYKNISTVLHYRQPVEHLAHYKQNKNNGVRSIIPGAWVTDDD